MPTTSPDDIFYADGSTAMSAEDISAAEATSVQDALSAFRDDSYFYRQTLYFTTSGTFSKASYPWLRAIRVKCVGGGGGGGGAASTGAGATAIAGAGGGGEYAELFITDIAGLASSVTVTVGAGGAGGAAGNNNGSDGGASSFGALLGAGAGTAGSGQNAFSASFRTGNSPGRGGSGGTGTADLRVIGSGGLITFGEPSVVAQSMGGASFLGGQEISARVTTGTNGDNAINYGAGGNGGANAASQGTARSGGNGAAGVVIVELFG